MENMISFEMILNKKIKNLLIKQFDLLFNQDD